MDEEIIIRSVRPRRAIELIGYVWWLEDLDAECKRRLEIKDKPREHKFKQGEK